MGLGTDSRAQAEEIAKRINNTRFFTELREGRLSRKDYIVWISSLYPIVVGFCGSLCKTIGKLDPVRDTALIAVLARQLHEEIEHNGLWRFMLKHYGVDHRALYENYLRGDTRKFPGAALAMARRMKDLGDDTDPLLWLASQGAIEMMILPLETTSVYPGVLRSPQLDPNDKSVAWHREHSAQGNSAEVRHLKQAERMLNVLKLDPTRQALIFDETRKTLTMFGAAILSG